MSDKDEEDVVNMRPPETESHAQTDSDIEAKLATVKDQKEAKRLKRYRALSRMVFHGNPVLIMNSFRSSSLHQTASVSLLAHWKLLQSYF